jgi:hypothetical protein
MFLLLSVFACGSPDPGSADASQSATATVVIHEEIWDDAGQCWSVRDVERPAADWPSDCNEVIDTGARWAYELHADADGNCVRLPIHCPETDSFIADCAAVAQCCDDTRLGLPTCF